LYRGAITPLGLPVRGFTAIRRKGKDRSAAMAIPVPASKRIRRPRGGFFYIPQTKVRGNNSFGPYLMNQGIHLKVFIGHYL
jgi:hypothetical protein